MRRPNSPFISVQTLNHSCLASIEDLYFLTYFYILCWQRLRITKSGVAGASRTISVF